MPNTRCNVQLLNYSPYPEKIIAIAAKLCYSDSDITNLMANLTMEKVNEFVKKLEEMGHESPFEHVSFTFGIEGVSRSLTHQLTRHRIASYSQQSQRYVKLKQFDYIIPPAIAEDEYTARVFISHMINSQTVYDLLVDKLTNKYINKYLENESKLIAEGKIVISDSMRGIIPKSVEADAIKKAIEDARYAFPNACETKIIMTMNVRELWNFFNHRCCNRAQWEIRYLAKEILRICKQISPILFKNAGASCIKGICPEGNMQCVEFKNRIPTLKDFEICIK